MTRCFVVTSNLGSVFENEDIEEAWMQEFEKVVSDADPDVLALHLQEVGGKDYEMSMPKVGSFIKKFRNLKCFTEFDRSRGFFDTAFEDVEEFTALGNLYLFHSRLKDVHQWDFSAKCFTEIRGHEVVTKELPKNIFCHKERFPNGYYPDVKWSRKGYLLTRWRLHTDAIVNFVNIHLFHDEDNLVALEKSPSVYCAYRRRGLNHTIRGVTQAIGGQSNEPIFIFGDFNFRLDLSAVMKDVLSRDRQAQHIREENGTLSKVIYRDSGEPAITVERKKFIMRNGKQFSEDFAELLHYDSEPEKYQELGELSVRFPPSYPFSEETEEGSNYLDKRCPAWCDRILMTKEALSLVQGSPSGSTYDMMARESCVGDHKPVYLFFSIPRGSGQPHSGNMNLPLLCVMGAFIGLVALGVYLQW